MCMEMGWMDHDAGQIQDSLTTFAHGQARYKIGQLVNRLSRQ